MTSKLTQWKKGQSGNPHGRPKKGETLADVAREYLSGFEKLSNGEIVTRKLLYVQKVCDMAMRGDTSAAKLIWNYVDGTPSQTLDQDDKDEQHIKLTIKDLSRN